MKYKIGDEFKIEITDTDKVGMYKIGDKHSWWISGAVLEGLPKIRKGFWIQHDPDCRGLSDSYECSECGCLTRYPYAVCELDYEYCPNCGSYNGG